MHQMWKTFRDSCSTRVFIQVDEKNALKHPKSWWLGVAPCSVVFSLIYLIDIRGKWQILVKVIFDPSSCLENMNKHRETTLHIQIPYSGPKEHQNLKNFWRIWEKSKKIDFSVNFHGWIWPFPDLKPVTIGQIWCPLCPLWGILMAKFLSTGFWVHWT